MLLEKYKKLFGYLKVAAHNVNVKNCCNWSDLLGIINRIKNCPFAGMWTLFKSPDWIGSKGKKIISRFCGFDWNKELKNWFGLWSEKYHWVHLVIWEGIKKIVIRTGLMGKTCK